MAGVCWDCQVDHHSRCEFMVGDDPGEPDEDGWYTVTCCCGGWADTRQTLEAEYREMNEQLKPLQWPDAPQPR